MSYTLAVARRGGRSARIFPLCGRYARLLRRSRCAGIAFAPGSLGVWDFLGRSRCAGGAVYLFVTQRNDRAETCFFCWMAAAQHWGVVACSFCFFLRWLTASARCPGVASRRHPLFFFDTGLWLLPGIWAWSPARRGAGGERGNPSTPPTTPVLPLSAWRRASLSHVVYLGCRSPRGAVGAHLPALRAICAPAAALPLRGDRLRARLAGRMGFFGAFALRGGSGLPFRYAAKRQGRDMFLLLDSFSPASGRGRLRGGRQGVRGACPSTPPTTHVLPLVRVAAGVAVACRVPCPPLAAEGGRRKSSRFAGDMRACCGAPAVRGSPSHPGSLGGWDFFRLSRCVAASSFSGMKIPS